MPRWLRRLLQALGIVAWLWIVVQAFVGGTGDGDVASLFLWVYGWVGVALSAPWRPDLVLARPVLDDPSALAGVGARLRALGRQRGRSARSGWDAGRL